MLQIVVQFHITQSREAVEPGIGNASQGLGETLLFDADDQFVARAGDFFRPGAPGDHHSIASRFGRLNVFLGEPKQMGTMRNGLDEVATGLRRIGFQFGFVQVAFLYLFLEKYEQSCSCG